MRKKQTAFFGEGGVDPSQFGSTLFQFSLYLVLVAADLSYQDEMALSLYRTKIITFEVQMSQPSPDRCPCAPVLTFHVIQLPGQLLFQLQKKRR